VSLLAAAAGPDVAGAAGDVLGRLDAAAAARNDYLQLFRSQQHFPEVRRRVRHYYDPGCLCRCPAGTCIDLLLAVLLPEVCVLLGLLPASGWGDRVIQCSAQADRL
jgi:hypothetical protein